MSILLIQNHLKKLFDFPGPLEHGVHNSAVRRYLRQLLPGTWQKVIKQGNRGEVHYGEHASGQVAGVTYYPN